MKFDINFNSVLTVVPKGKRKEIDFILENKITDHEIKEFNLKPVMEIINPYYDNYYFYEIDGSFYYTLFGYGDKNEIGTYLGSDIKNKKELNGNNFGVYGIRYGLPEWLKFAADVEPGMKIVSEDTEERKNKILAYLNQFVFINGELAKKIVHYQPFFHCSSRVKLNDKNEFDNETYGPFEILETYDQLKTYKIQNEETFKIIINEPSLFKNTKKERVISKMLSYYVPNDFYLYGSKNDLMVWADYRDFISEWLDKVQKNDPGIYFYKKMIEDRRNDIKLTHEQISVPYDISKAYEYLCAIFNMDYYKSHKKTYGHEHHDLNKISFCINILKTEIENDFENKNVLGV